MRPRKRSSRRCLPTSSTSPCKPTGNKQPVCIIRKRPSVHSSDPARCTHRMRSIGEYLRRCYVNGVGWVGWVLSDVEWEAATNNDRLFMSFPQGATLVEQRKRERERATSTYVSGATSQWCGGMRGMGGEGLHIVSNDLLGSSPIGQARSTKVSLLFHHQKRKSGANFSLICLLIYWPCLLAYLAYLPTLQRSPVFRTSQRLIRAPFCIVLRANVCSQRSFTMLQRAVCAPWHISRTRVRIMPPRVGFCVLVAYHAIPCNTSAALL